MHVFWMSKPDVLNRRRPHCYSLVSNTQIKSPAPFLPGIWHNNLWHFFPKLSGRDTIRISWIASEQDPSLGITLARLGSSSITKPTLWSYLWQIVSDEHSILSFNNICVRILVCGLFMICSFHFSLAYHLFFLFSPTYHSGLWKTDSKKISNLINVSDKIFTNENF